MIDGWDRPDIQNAMDSAGIAFIKHQIVLLLYTVRTYGKCKEYWVSYLTWARYINYTECADDSVWTASRLVVVCLTLSECLDCLVAHIE